MDCPLHHTTFHLHNLKLEWCAPGCSQSLVKLSPSLLKVNIFIDNTYEQGVCSFESKALFHAPFPIQTCPPFPTNGLNDLVLLIGPPLGGTFST